MPAGDRKMPDPIVMPTTRATELHSPSVRGSLLRCMAVNGTTADPRFAISSPGCYDASPMLPALRSRSETGLDAALQRLVPGGLPDRPDSPDLHVTAVRQIPATVARHAPFPASIDPRLIRALASRGVRQLYTHQAEAIGHALGGRNVVVTTPTASGKTLCYNAPVLNAMLRDPSSRALYLFPTKALAQDQLAELQALCEQIEAEAG